jgi:hypothetical protein
MVYGAAIDRKSVDETERDLNQLRPSAGGRIKDYIADLRSENKLDIRIEDGRLILVVGLLKNQ